MPWRNLWTWWMTSLPTSWTVLSWCSLIICWSTRSHQRTMQNIWRRYYSDYGITNYMQKRPSARLPIRRSSSYTWRIMFHWSEVGSCSQLEGTPKCERRLLIPWIRQLLLEVHTSVRQSSTPVDRIDQKGCGVAMGTLPATVFPEIENQIMHSANTAVR